MKKSSCIAKPVPVVFVTSVFGEVHNGPALYADYLWTFFKDDPDIDFHLVTTVSSVKHDRIHVIGVKDRSLDVYRCLQLRAMEIANMIAGGRAIIHGNNAHSMDLLRDYEGPVMGQINDYDAASIIRSPFSTIFRQGFRRFLSLLYRHRNEQRFMYFSDLLVCNSEFVLDQVNRHYRIPDTLPTRVIYKSIDFSDFPIGENNIGESGDLLFIGSNWMGKGLDIAMRALDMLPQEFDQLRLVVAGECSAGSTRIYRLAKNLHIEHRVVFLGNVSREELPSLITKSSILLFPSRNEALGVAVIEAVASCVPVIASNVGGITEVLKGTICSRLVSNRSAEYARSIESLLSDYPAQELLEKDWEYVRIKFNKIKMIEEIKKVYLKVYQI